MDRRSYLALVGGAALSGCAGIGISATPTGEYDVGMRSSAFVPRDVEISVGETVVWLNNSSRPHTVTAYDGGIPDGAKFFASGGYESDTAARDAYHREFGGAIYTDEVYEHRFDVAGTYDYFCVPHERGGMVGRVIVNERG